MDERSRWIWMLVLALFAALSGWWLWSLQPDDESPPLTGPPRSDYSLDDFELTALDEDGQESFSVKGPRLTRHPQLATLDIAEPRFTFPDDNGGQWDANARHAWVSDDGGELRLDGDYLIQGPEDPDEDRIRMTGPDLRLFPKQNLAETDHEVTVRDGRSILRGVGMKADLNQRTVHLSKMDGRFQPSR